MAATLAGQPMKIKPKEKRRPRGTANRFGGDGKLAAELLVARATGAAEGNLAWRHDAPNANTGMLSGSLNILGQGDSLRDIAEN